MKRFTLPIICTLALLAIVIASAIGVTSILNSASAKHANKQFRQHNMCGTAKAGHVKCQAIEVDSMDAASEGMLRPNAAGMPNGLAPTDLQQAYKLPSSTAGQNQTVAVVDAFGYPNAEKDLAVYRQQFGLPACTTANGCFKKVDQNGGTNYPTANAGWSGETALDMDMVSAVCPNCNILLVEAKDSMTNNLGLAVDMAVKLGAKIVSNSYGGGDAPGFAAHYRHPGVILTASTGDSGAAPGAQAPAVYNTVVAVGGTSLQRDNSARGWNESAWSGAGSGCSASETKPTWQKDAGCKFRVEADVSAVADPRTGVAVYLNGNWSVFGGTSASAPIIAGVYALAGNPQSANAASSLYVHTDQLFDVTTGSNGTNCAPAYVCKAGTGYDGPTGLGTPNGVAAFSASGQSTPPGTGQPTPTQTPVQPTPTQAPVQPTPTQVAPPNPGSFGSTTQMTAEEKQLSLQLFDQINKERAAVGLAAYTLDENITRAAYKHTLMQANANTISHQLSGEAAVGTRLKNEGVVWNACGENVGYAGGYGSYWKDVLVVHQQMMAEPANVGHHAAIISKTYHRIGLSVLIHNGRVYLTEDFAN